MQYRVAVSVNVSPGDENYAHNSLNFFRTFMLEGENFSDIAPKIDKLEQLVQEAISE